MSIDPDDLINTAAQLIGCVRDYDPKEGAAVMDPLTPAHWYSLCFVLAAMVDPDKSPSELLAWTTAGPVQSRSFEASSLRTNADKQVCPDCGRQIRGQHMSRHRRTHARQVA